MSRRPIFLLSLPRSGSTLVQRVLAAHSEVETVSEPWLLLPHLYALRSRGIVTEYSQPTAVRAIGEFVDRMPGGLDDYDAAIREFALTLYDRASTGTGSYFLDKTPRYHYVLPELFRTFPDAKFLFLWRNPLSVIASIVETWCGGRWNVGRWLGDLQGIASLVSSYEEHRDEVIAVRYEELVAAGEDAWRELFSYLGLDFEPDALVSFSEVRLDGRMGDPTGVQRYASISTDGIDKWRRTLGGPWRKAWCGRYLQWIGNERLRTMGYQLDELTAALDELPSRPWTLPADSIRGSYWSLAQRRKRLAFRWMAPRLRRP